MRAGGEILVSLLGSDYKPLEGYRPVAVRGDGVELPVRWSARQDLEAARRHGDVRLEFQLRDTSLYSFRIN
jgi:hypothetical protein